MHAHVPIIGLPDFHLAPMTSYSLRARFMLTFNYLLEFSLHSICVDFKAAGLLLFFRGRMQIGKGATEIAVFIQLCYSG